MPSHSQKAQTNMPPCSECENKPAHHNQTQTHATHKNTTLTQNKKTKQPQTKKTTTPTTNQP
jgi:hypothetical protein